MPARWRGFAVPRGWCGNEGWCNARQLLRISGGDDAKGLQAMGGTGTRRDKRQQAKRENAALSVRPGVAGSTHDQPQKGFRMS